MSRFEDDGGRGTGGVRLNPTFNAEAPVIARTEAGKHVLGTRCAKVVANRLGKGQKLFGHHRANRVLAIVIPIALAAPVAGIPGQRLRATSDQWFPEDVSGVAWPTHKPCYERKIAVVSASLRQVLQFVRGIKIARPRATSQTFHLRPGVNSSSTGH